MDLTSFSQLHNFHLSPFIDSECWWVICFWEGDGTGVANDAPLVGFIEFGDMGVTVEEGIIVEMGC